MQDPCTLKGNTYVRYFVEGFSEKDWSIVKIYFV